MHIDVIINIFYNRVLCPFASKLYSTIVYSLYNEKHMHSSIHVSYILEY